MRTTATATGLLLLALFAGSMLADRAAGKDLPGVYRKVGFDQRLNEQVPLDLEFVDETGKTVKLGDYFGKKPVILVLAYYKCPMLCTKVLNGLAQGLKQIPFEIGKEFNVVTVSFDPRETPDLAARKKETYVAAYGRPGAAAGWHFLTGKQPSIDKLTDAVGFRYVYDAKEDTFLHTSGIMVLTPGGKLSRYFYDVKFPPRDLRLGLVEASEEKIGSPVDVVLLYCSHYDPQTGKYTASILNFVRAGGVFTIMVVVGMMWILFRRGKKKRAAAAKQATPAGLETAGNSRGEGP